MKNKQDLEKQAEQTLNSLDSLQQVEANEFLHAKILHRMQIKSATNATNVLQGSHIIYQLPISAQTLMMRLVAVLCLFVCLNIATYIILKQPKQATTKTINGADAFADAYG